MLWIYIIYIIYIYYCTLRNILKFMDYDFDILYIKTHLEIHGL